MALAGVEKLDFSPDQTNIAHDTTASVSQFAVSELRSESVLASLLEAEEATPSPDVDELFPWLHGIHEANTSTLAFFGQRLGKEGWCNLYERPNIRCGLMRIKVGDEMNLCGTLRYSFKPDDILDKEHFRDRPKGVLTIRDFASQPARYATVCDILVYSPSFDNESDVRAISNIIAKEQNALGLSRRTYSYVGKLPEAFLDRSEYIIYDPFVESFSAGRDGHLYAAEQIGILHVTKASPIAEGVWMGNGTDVRHFEHMRALNGDAYADRKWNLFVECSAGYGPADLPTLPKIDQLIRYAVRNCDEMHNLPFSFLKFPGFGVLGQLDTKLSCILVSFCKLIYVRGQYNGTLIYSDDGYRCNSILGILYLIYTRMLSVEDALLDLQVRARRPISLHPTDVALAARMMPLLHKFSPLSDEYGSNIGAVIDIGTVPCPMPLSGWLREFKGSFPSKILPYLFLGSIIEANNHRMLKALGIRRVISVGERLAWRSFEDQEVVAINDLQDDGTDSLENVLPYLFSILEDSYLKNIPTLVHCRMGVSRSAAVCIAEVMRRLHYSLPEAYFHVRVRRLNVVIQPNLRLMYELLRYEEKRKQGSRKVRATDWPTLCQEIVALNLSYSE